MKLLDVVALLRDLPQKNLATGQVGTAVEDLGEGVFEIEFSDLEGRAYAFAALRAQDVMVLRHEPVRAAA